MNDKIGEKSNKNEDMSFAEMFESASAEMKAYEAGDRVEALVVAIDQDNVFLDLGTRVEGRASREDFTEGEGLSVAVGDTTVVYVTGKKSGRYLCSSRVGGSGSPKNDSDRAAKAQLQEAFNNSHPVEGKVSAVNKGGFDVTVMGVRCFCPVSQIDTNYCEEPDVHINKVYAFRIMRFEEDGNNVVVSRRSLLEEEAELIKEKAWENLELNGEYDGEVTRIMPYGAFVDIGGIEGLLHVSEIDYSRIEDAGQFFSQGDKVRVQIINIDPAQKRISLSRKSLLEDPWDSFADSLKAGQEFTGRVVRMKPYGIFVTIAEGIDGLVHISKMSSRKKIKHPKEMVKLGDSLKVRVIDIDRERRSISLSMEEEEYDYSEDMKKLKSDLNRDQAKNTTLGNLLDSVLDKR